MGLAPATPHRAPAHGHVRHRRRAGGRGTRRRHRRALSTLRPYNVGILLTQTGMSTPDSARAIHDFWTTLYQVMDD
ncbi:hypothetical protein DEJ48_02870 [Streptomyces venezuelae]|uniref:Uncharacterized protein n=1 Tax=Streptomyces venezuelae TaxID=54571 RepID=A0A5P2BPS8_STRVZ|nr:hypothetical protein DEJ48_02870 [Streptomyces venezuelae]